MKRNLPRRASALVIVVIGALALVSAAPAFGQADSRQSAALSFTEQAPGAPTGLRFSVDYVNPTDPSAKPPSVRNVVEELAAGARIDTSIPEQCTAVDLQLMLLGAAACPAGSQVGTGTLRLDTGLPEPARFIDADIDFLNNAGELIFVSTVRGLGVRVVTRSTVEQGRIVNSAPLLPGAPPDGAAIDLVETEFPPVSRFVDGTRRAYVTTPSQCPPDGSWTNSTAFTYADGISQTVSTSSPCTPTASAPTVGGTAPVAVPAKRKCKRKGKAKRKREAKPKRKAKRKRCARKRGSRPR